MAGSRRHTWTHGTARLPPPLTLSSPFFLSSLLPCLSSPQVSSDETQRLIKMEEVLHGRVIGQEEAVTAISRAIRRARVGLKNPSRPIASFIFSGACPRACVCLEFGALGLAIALRRRAAGCPSRGGWPAPHPKKQPLFPPKTAAAPDNNSPPAPPFLYTCRPHRRGQV